MPEPSGVLSGTTTDGPLLVVALALPVVGLLVAFASGRRGPERVALLVMPAGLAIAVAVAASVLRADAPLVYVLGAWAPPLGISLRADGLSAAMLLTTAVVACVVGLFARGEFRTPAGLGEARRPFVFWTLFLGLWAALNAVFLGNDLFNLFVALELLTFSAVPLVSLDGRAETVAAALRYLLFALVGSALYLVGVALLYGAYGTLDIALLSTRVRAEPAVLVAAALMTAGLMAKTALFPLHFWLPPAHAGAPAAGSALLSALVVKASFFLVVRLWFDVLAAVPKLAAVQVLGGLGAAAILFGGVLALRQVRLKMVVAYSTVAQIGYLFLIFPLVAAPDASLAARVGAWNGGILHLMSHALAKAAMFLAAGLIARAVGHDHVAGLAGVARARPVTVLAFALGGLSLMGLPPSGGSAATSLLRAAAVETGQWWWAMVMLIGAALTGGYLFRVLARTLAGGRDRAAGLAPVALWLEMLVLALALGSFAVGLAPVSSFHLVQIGRLGAMPEALGD